MASITLPASESQPEERPNRPWKKWLLILLLALALLGAAGAAGWYFLLRPHGDSQQAGHKPEAPAAPPVFMVLEPFTVNLQGEGQFLQAGFTLQLASQEETDKLKMYLPQARSRLLMLMSAKTASELISVEGKNRLLQEVMGAVAQPFAAGVPPVKVSNVFITSFVIQ